jgi:hypothetical protein
MREMEDLKKKKKRLQLALFTAAAIGCSSITMSTTLVVLGFAAAAPFSSAAALA